ncbi:hypothetical protein TWF481_005849 [Arthrobotrys musiformis]|uniref:Uncharacterized protein n=1 Tax=Arthrobotrys musiformis TaxID=47236 RepID=A0AAV9WEZ4_9PEZI
MGPVVAFSGIVWPHYLHFRPIGQPISRKLSSTISVVFLAAATAASAFHLNVNNNLLPRAGCNADNCLRAVRATQHGSRGVNDCLAYWRTTYTPPLSTSYTTTTIETSTTSTDSLTVTATIHTTLTTSTPTTTTETVATTFFKTVSLSNDIQKRIANDPYAVQEGNTIATYASFCSGVVRYSSACSCVGVSTITTITAPIPITTSTITETSTTITIPASITVKTESTTTTDATATVPSISVSQTLTGPTHTATAFALQVVSPAGFAGRYLKVVEYTWSAYELQVTTSSAEAETFYFNPSDANQVTIVKGSNVFWAAVLGDPSENSVLFVPRSEIDTPFGLFQLTCSIGGLPDRTLSCSDTFGWNTFAFFASSLTWIKSPASAHGSFVPAVIKAVPVPY